MQTKLGFIGENHLAGVEADAKFAAQHGFEGIEYNYWGDFRDLTEETVKKMAAIHKAHGVRACSLGLWGWNHLAQEPKARKEAHAQLRRALEFAKILRADVVITGGGDIAGEPLGRKVAEFCKVFPPLFKSAQKAGLRFAFYAVHGNSFFESIAAYEAVWEHFPDVKIKFDPANWKHHGDDYLEILRRYAHKIGHIHVKEHLYHRGALASQPAAGMGDIEWGRIFAFLYEKNYNGWLVIEPHGPIWGRAPLREKMLLLTKRYISQFIV